MFDRVIAVDWSGAMDSSHRKKIWVADLRRGVVDLRSGRTREEVTDWLRSPEVSESKSILIGLDFSFSMPKWFVDERFGGSHQKLWDHCVEPASTAFLNSEFFWGRHERKDPKHVEEGLRQTELLLKNEKFNPYSVFRLVGAAQVGCGAIRGFATLKALRADGYAIWPFDPPSDRTVVEIYPRLFAPKVKKTDRQARSTHLQELERSLPKAIVISPTAIRDAQDSDDAFDALISVVGLAAGESNFVTEVPGEIARIEGAIYRPPCAHSLGAFPLN